ncbi:hypothetical protein [Brevundimonas sp. DC300-4]|uniref:hypothetical protein n=1 Tax=Brevundimonas sp. DC300-4 TaxID=2804594 RepID=UPI003CED0188
MTHAVSTIPLAIIAGKDFAHSWEIAQTASGPAEDLSGVGAVEFRMARVGLPATDTLVWSITSGHFSIVGSEMVLTVAGDETQTIPTGSWTWLLSYGASEAETPLVTGKSVVTVEP